MKFVDPRVFTIGFPSIENNTISTVRSTSKNISILAKIKKF
jgi:hypothetical protein